MSKTFLTLDVDVGTVLILMHDAADCFVMNEKTFPDNILHLLFWMKCQVFGLFYSRLSVPLNEDSQEAVILKTEKLIPRYDMFLDRYGNYGTLIKIKLGLKNVALKIRLFFLYLLFFSSNKMLFFLDVIMFAKFYNVKMFSLKVM